MSKFENIIIGVLMLDTSSPKIPGDPANSKTFKYPIITEKVIGISAIDLLNESKSNWNTKRVLEGAKKLEKRGVSLIVGDCGLFSSYQEKVSSSLEVPFIGSSLVFVPFLEKVFSKKIGLLVGDSRLETGDFFVKTGINLERVRICGMERAPEFRSVILEGTKQIEIDRMRREVVDLVNEFSKKNKDMSCLVLECTNLIPFAFDIQIEASLPVFDVVVLTEMFCNASFRKKL